MGALDPSATYSKTQIKTEQSKTQTQKHLNLSYAYKNVDLQ